TATPSGRAFLFRSRVIYDTTLSKSYRPLYPPIFLPIFVRGQKEPHPKIGRGIKFVCIHYSKLLSASQACYNSTMKWKVFRTVVVFLLLTIIVVLLWDSMWVNQPPSRIPVP